MNEIRSQPLLRVFGSLLAFTHCLTAYFWLDGYWGHIPHFTDALPLCWPHLAGCESWGRLSVNQLFVVMGIYASLAAAAGVLFYYPAKTRWAVNLLFAASILKFALFQLDYRLSGNYHYMHFWLLAAFFFLPQKSISLRLFMIAFYLGASLLKFNHEWLSGSAIPPNPYLGGAWLKAGCWYVLALETVLVFGLLSRQRFIFWATIVQLYLFHAFSFFIVSYYYPLLFMTLLSLFILERLRDPSEFNFHILKELNWISKGALILFAFAQLVPIVLGGDRALEGRGKIFALSMFDAHAECDFKVALGDGRLLARQYFLEERLKCDPHVLLTDARWRCRQLGDVYLDVRLRSKRSSENEFQPIFDFRDFCRQPHRMNIWGVIN